MFLTDSMYVLFCLWLVCPQIRRDCIIYGLWSNYKSYMFICPILCALSLIELRLSFNRRAFDKKKPAIYI